MSVSNRWYEAYVELTDFIAKHPEVKISASTISIPENVRPEFYRLFGAVRTAFVEEKFPSLLNEGRLLSENYLKAEEEVIKLLGLEDISASPSLHRFLHDPIDGLIRVLFNPLFDLLKGKTSIETFKEKGSKIVEIPFRGLYLSGYEKWVVLSLVKLLQADKSFQVIVRDIRPEEEKMIMGGDSFEKEIPLPEESKHLSFKHGLYPIFTVPDFIVHSANMARYVAMRSEYSEAVLRASNANDGREWYPLDSMVTLEPSLSLIYVADKPEEISLVADVEKICRPDLIIECRGQKDWYEKEGLEKVKLNNSVIQPKLGTYIVTREQVSEQAYKELIPEQEQKPSHKLGPEKQEREIYMITTGFDQSKLEPIISVLMSQRSEIFYGKS